MKDFTKLWLLGVALATSSGVSAQDGILKFETDKFEFMKMQDWYSHRSCPFFGDFNNDGNMDIYYGGTSWWNGWTARGILMQGLGEGKYQSHSAIKTEIVIVKEQAKDGEGNLLWENPDAPEGEEKIPVMIEKEVEQFAGMANGLPLSTFGLGSLPIDFNQDGLVDLLIQNTGGNDTGTKGGFILVKNLGNFQFEVVEDEALASLSNGSDWDGDKWNEDMHFGSTAIGDYDKDGYPDILAQEHHTGTKVCLFRNVNGERFEIVKVFDPLPLDKEINMNTLYVKTEDEIDEEGEIIPGDYTETPTYEAMGMRHGQVMMGDFNGDGWLDIVSVGYTDGPASLTYGPQVGGAAIRFYQNTKDGRFQDVTDNMIEEAARIIATLPDPEGEDAVRYEAKGTIEDVYKVWGSYDALWYAMDWNQDGILDIVMSGDLNYRTGKKMTIALVAEPDAEGNMCFKEESTSLLPVAQPCNRAPIIADLNGDDVVDFILYGWTSYEDRNNWCNGYMSSNGEVGSYTLMDEWYGPDAYQSGSHHGDRVTSFGDVNGDGLLDMLTTDWTDAYQIEQPDGTMKEGCERLVPSYNISVEPADLVTPEAPSGLVAEAGETEGSVVVTWDGSALKTGFSAMYNLYIEDAAGKVRMLAPANKKTGSQLGYPQFSSYVLGNMDDGCTYTFEKLPEGEYTVGVQAVNYGYLASGFATATVTVTNGYTSVKTVKPAVETKVVVNGNTITVNSNEDAAVEVYAVSGASVAQGRTNETLTVNGKGVFVVKANGQSVKVVK